MTSTSSVPTSPLSPTSPSPSSSAIPIIRPGKPILKKAPPPQRSFFSLSTFSKLLPSTPNAVLPVSSSSASSSTSAAAGPKDTPLKRAHFILPQMSTVYPILSSNPPHTPNIKEEKRNIELKEAERRRKIVRSISGTSINEDNKEEEEWWSMDKVETFYKECCAGREEVVNPTVTTALRHAATTSPRALDLSGIQLSLHSASALADILSIEWGLRKLVLRECDLTHQTIKPILHALLITNTLLFFSIASNRNMRTLAFKLLGAYISKSSTIQYLDLSQNALEKKAVEFIVLALGTSPPHSPNAISPPQTPSLLQNEHAPNASTSSLLSLRLDDCSLKQPSLEMLAQTVRNSSLRNISLRHNRINATGAVALALMIKDYPDSIPSTFSSGGASISSTISASTPQPQSQQQRQYHTLPSHNAPSPFSSSYPSSQHSNTPRNISSTTPQTHLPPNATATVPAARKRPVSLAPPPRHPTSSGANALPQTTYTPYIPKSKRTVGTSPGRSPLTPSLQSTPASTPTTATATANAKFLSLSASVHDSASAVRQQQQQQQQQHNIKTYNNNDNEISSQTSASSTTTTTTAAAAPPSSPTESLTLVDHTDTVPIITSSAQGGITTRHPPPPLRLGSAATTAISGHASGYLSTPTRSLSGSYDPLQQPSATLLDKVRALDNLPRLGALRTLDLKGNDIKGGTLYIAQVLKRNRTLKILNLSENKIDAVGLTQIAESLKYNSCLETLDLSKNPCCGPSLEGIQHLRTALTLNTSLKRLFLSNTSLTSSGAIMLAEFLPEAQALLHLDLTLNPALDHAGVLALSVGLKKNFVIRCLDLNIEPGNEEMARFCRDILNVCVRNTEEAARAAGLADEKGGGGAGNGGAGAGAGTGDAGVKLNVGRAKGLWSMIEESELAKSIHIADDVARKSVKDDSNRDGDTDVLVRAVECKVQLEEVLTRVRVGVGSRARTSGLQFFAVEKVAVSSALSATVNVNEDEDHATLARSKTVLPLLVSIIQATTTDPDPDTRKMEEMLVLNDDLTVLIRDVEAALGPGTRPISRRNSGASTTSANSLGLENGHITSGEHAEIQIEEDEGEDGDSPPTTPKVDKGKGKALPESQESSPVLQKLIMGSSFSITDSDEEDEEERLRRSELEEELRQLQEQGGGEAISPTVDRSRILLEEEGEIFRKGQALLSEAEMESEYAGEELRQGLLEAQLERPPARQLEPETGFDDNHIMVEVENDTKSNTADEPLRSPLSPRTYLVRQRSNGSDVAK